MCWLRLIKKLKDDGIVCVNISDPTKTCNEQFVLFSNGAKTIAYFQAKGFRLLPPIIWNQILNLLVTTKQEILIQMLIIKNLKEKEGEIIAEYKYWLNAKIVLKRNFIFGFRLFFNHVISLPLI